MSPLRRQITSTMMNVVVNAAPQSRTCTKYQEENPIEKMTVSDAIQGVAENDSDVNNVSVRLANAAFTYYY